MMGRAFWVTGPGRVEVRDEVVEARPGLVLVEAEVSGISRGTEALVLRGGVPEGERARMRCPLQAGEFPFPVKYGYAAVGRLAGGARVFVLHPHQDRFAVPEAMAVPVPDGVPPARAVLAANMETALNVVWDGRAAPCDRIAVVGAGVVGCLAAWLCARLPGAEVTLVDVNPGRAAVAAALGVRFVLPGAVPEGCDLVIHASASAAGLGTALAAAGPEAVVVEASWYGDREVALPLGGAVHSRRLRIVGSQVGEVPPARRARWTHRRRLEAALGLLADPVLDVLISGETAFGELAGRYGAILDDPGTLCHLIRYR
jgi:threonine dehydrogenase-like Zn-dependent dehydrogenase